MNPIKIAVPGAKSFIADAFGVLEKVDSIGNYNWNVTGVSGKKVLMKIAIIMPDNSVIHEEKKFEIRPIQKPRGFINSNYEWRVYEMTREQLAEVKLGITIDDLYFPLDSLYTTPEAFILSLSENEELRIKGNTMNEYAKTLIDKLQIGSIVYIKNIEEYNPHDYCMRSLPKLKIKIVDGPVEEIITPEPLISLKNQNFVYRGIDNQLGIAVPGAKSFKVTADGGFRESGGMGDYSWNVTQIKTNTTTLDFEIVTVNDSVFSTSVMFHVKDAPKMITTINDRGCENCIIELTKDEVKETKISIGFANYSNKWTNFNVKQYSLILPDGNLYKVYQNKFSDSAQKMIFQFPVGSIFKITDIEFTSHSYITYRPELKFMLVEKY